MRFHEGDLVRLSQASWSSLRESHGDTALLRFFGLSDLSEPPIGKIIGIVERPLVTRRPEVQILFNLGAPEHRNILTYKETAVVPVGGFEQRVFAEGG